MEEILNMLDDIFYVFSCKKPNYLEIDVDLYEVLGNWWCSDTIPSSVEDCKVSAHCSHTSITIQYNPDIPTNVMERRGKRRKHCKWEILLRGNDITKSYHFATKEGFSQILNVVLRELTENGKEAKRKTKCYECFY